MKSKLPIYGFMHCCAVNNYKDVVQEQVNKIFSSKLYHACERVSVGVTGEYDRDFFSTLPDKFYVDYKSDNVKEYEFPTLNLLYKRCLEEDCFVWYIHTKGIFNKGKKHHRYGNQIYWRNKMEMYVIIYWRNCVDMLNKFNYQTCGPVLDDNHKRFGRIYAGNFWWAKGSYIRKLNDPMKCDKSQRHWAEGWLLCNNIKDSNIAIDIEKYVKNKS